MQTATLEAKTRPSLGKNSAKQSRKKGLVPGVVYGSKGTALNIEFEASELEKIFRTTKNANTLITLTVQDGDQRKEFTTLPRELSKDAISQKFLHVDFFAVDKNAPIKTVVKLKFTGVSPGVKMGGNISYNLFSLKVKSLPEEVPDFIEIPLSVLELGSVYRVKDVAVSAGIEFLNGAHETIVKVDSPKGAEDEAAKVEAAKGKK